MLLFQFLQTVVENREGRRSNVRHPRADREDRLGVEAEIIRPAVIEIHLVLCRRTALVPAAQNFRGAVLFRAEIGHIRFRLRLRLDALLAPRLRRGEDIVRRNALALLFDAVGDQREHRAFFKPVKLDAVVHRLHFAKLERTRREQRVDRFDEAAVFLRRRRRDRGLFGEQILDRKRIVGEDPDKPL